MCVCLDDQRHLFEYLLCIESEYETEYKPSFIFTCRFAAYAYNFSKKKKKKKKRKTKPVETP